ncbi:CocE/NonD family hydrolase [Kitasatospora sp. NPDC004240]
MSSPAPLSPAPLSPTSPSPLPSAPLPYRTTREDLRVPLPDGTELAARLWRPVTDEPVPVLVEYSPDRLGDRTAADDARRHPWYAGHGYACARVDVRGHGNSDGVAGDFEQALEDGTEVVRHLAARPWCDGRAGLLGHGWAGDTALLLAARLPGTVRAVVAACPTPPGHRLGGALLAEDLHTRTAADLAAAALPPDPLHVGDAWRTRWLERLDALEPATPAAASASASAVPTLVVSGWGDPSCSAVLRLLAEPATHGVIGPWPHGLPDEVLPETLRWFDHWLRDMDTGVLKEPVLRARLGGRWIAEDSWPSPDVREIHYGLDGPLRTAGTASEDRWVHVRSPQHTGLAAGAYTPHGSAADLPPDQREEDGRSVCFDSAPLPEPVEILGAPAVLLRLAAVPGLVAARLCDVAPDGTSTLVTRGVLRPTTTETAVELAAAGHSFPAGHRLRLALSSAYWPWVWPAAEPTGYDVDPSHGTLTLPVRHLAAGGDAPPYAPAAPELPPPPAIHLTEPLTARPERLTVHDLARHEWRTELGPATDGTRTHPDGLVRDEHTVTAHRVLAGDPLSAETRTDRTVRLERPDIGWDVTVHTRTELRCDATHLTVHTRLTALEAGTPVRTREWHHRIPREEA